MNQIYYSNKENSIFIFIFAYSDCYKILAVVRVYS